MKKLLIILLFIPLISFGQETEKVYEITTKSGKVIKSKNYRINKDKGVVDIQQLDGKFIRFKTFNIASYVLLADEKLPKPPLPSPVFPEQNHSFNINNSQIEWIKVFDSKMTKPDIVKIIKSNGLFKDLVINENEIKGTIENLKADYQSLGQSSWATTIYIQNNSISFSFIIQFKNGRYRVLLNNILLKSLTDIDTGVVSFASNVEEPLSFYTTKKGKFKKRFLKKDAEIFAHTFTKIFSFKDYQKNNDDW
jgi:hypothetical protein